MKFAQTILGSLIIMFSSCRPMTAQHSNFKEAFLIKWKNSLQYTLNVAKKMPEDHYRDKPVKDVRSFGEQLVHIGEGLAYIGNVALEFPTVPQPADVNDKEAVVSYLRLQHNALSKAIKAKEASYFEETTSFWAGRMTRKKILDIVFNHCTHHRAQAIVQLRMEGIKPPNYIGW